MKVSFKNSSGGYTSRGFFMDIISFKIICKNKERKNRHYQEIWIPAVRCIPYRLVFRDKTIWDATPIRANEPTWFIFWLFLILCLMQERVNL